MILWSYIDKARPKAPNCEHDYLFLSQSGKPITVNTVKLVFSRMAKTSGVERLHAHLCRHTFAINYLLNGGDIFSLKEILGHTTLDMVNHYLHFTSSQITDQHRKYSPMDRLQEKEKEANSKKMAVSSTKWYHEPKSGCLIVSGYIIINLVYTLWVARELESLVK